MWLRLNFISGMLITWKVDYILSFNLEKICLAIWVLQLHKLKHLISSLFKVWNLSWEGYVWRSGVITNKKKRTNYHPHFKAFKRTQKMKCYPTSNKNVDKYSVIVLNKIVKVPLTLAFSKAVEMRNLQEIQRQWVLLVVRLVK